MMKVFTLALAAGMLLPLTANAADYGGYAGAYLQLSVNPRATGMGNAFAAVSDDVSGLFFNPGAAAQLKRISFGGAYRVLSMDRSLQQLAIIFPVRDEAAIGFSAEFASMGGIQGRNRLGDPTGELDNLEGVFSITFARRFSDILSLGGNARYYYKKLENTAAYSAGFDIGSMIHLKRGETLPAEFPVELLRLGAALRNVSAKYPWGTGDYWQTQGSLGSDVTDEVPLAGIVGVSVLTMNSKLLLAVDVEKTEHKSIKLYAGAEYRMNRYAALRSGLAQGRPTFGGGFFINLGKIDMQIDIAVEKAQNVGGWETIVGSTWQL
jgi:hypothetical protein